VSSGDLEDLTQEVWLVALARSPQFESDRATRAWLTQVCRRVAASERRSRARTPLLRDEPQAELPSAPNQVAEVEQHIDEQESLAALSLLSEGQLDVLALYGSGELSMREVAQLVGEPEATVYSRYRVAIDSVSKELRRSRSVGSRTSTAPPSRSTSIPPPIVPDLEAEADSGRLVIYRADDQAVMGRLGNVIITRWRGRMFERTSIEIGGLIDVVFARMNMPLVLINDVDFDLRIPSANERRSLREHVSTHSRQVAMVVDICNGPVTRLLAAIVNGIMLITRSETSFAIVPAVDPARYWLEPHARLRDGKLQWDLIAGSIYRMRTAL
jgi:RNA polymerase sigma-70 factor (ECF subfamily)